MILHTTRGMFYLEENKIIHRDLACRNLLVCSLNSQLIVKVADFGLGKLQDDSYYNSKSQLPIKWTCPEGLRRSKFTTASDVWSFGIVVWEVLSHGGTPYLDLSNQETISKVMNGYTMDLSNFCCDEKWKLIMNKCWSFKAEDRPSFSSLLNEVESFQKEDPKIINSMYVG